MPAVVFSSFTRAAAEMVGSFFAASVKTLKATQVVALAPLVVSMALPLAAATKSFQTASEVGG